MKIETQIEDIEKQIKELHSRIRETVFYSIEELEDCYESMERLLVTANNVLWTIDGKLGDKIVETDGLKHERE